MGPLAPCLLARPIPSCLIRLAITRHASRDVIVPIVSLIISPYGFSSLLTPSSDTTSGEGACLACGAFHVRTVWYDFLLSLLIPTLIVSFACLVVPCPSILWGVSVCRL